VKASVASRDVDMKKYMQQMEKLRMQVSGLRLKLAVDESRLEKGSVRLNASEEKLHELLARVSELEHEIEDKNAQLQACQREARTCSDDLQAERQHSAQSEEQLNLVKKRLEQTVAMLDAAEAREGDWKQRLSEAEREREAVIMSVARAEVRQELDAEHADEIKAAQAAAAKELADVKAEWEARLDQEKVCCFKGIALVCAVVGSLSLCSQGPRVVRAQESCLSGTVLECLLASVVQLHCIIPSHPPSSALCALPGPCEGVHREQ